MSDIFDNSMSKENNEINTSNLWIKLDDSALYDTEIYFKEKYPLDEWEKAVEESKKNTTDRVRIVLSDIEIDKENNTRPKPKYYRNTWEEDGITPVSPKFKEVHKVIMNGLARFVVLEGGVRAGKDVMGLALWSQYLMYATPDKEHLALGVTLEHAIRTILHSNGMGLLFLIPNGTFERESLEGGQRGVFKFKDAYGREKKILFYGNDKNNDNQKFQGFSIGSVYVNEGNIQKLQGIQQANDRMFKSSQPLMIITQNPVGEMEPFYKDFEKQHMLSKSEMSMVYQIKNLFKEKWDYLESSHLKNLNNVLEKEREDFLKKANVRSIKMLTESQKILYTQRIHEVSILYKTELRSIMVKDFWDFDYSRLDKEEINSTEKFGEFSMLRIMNYQEAFENPNNVKNGIDYFYAHFTCDDNYGLSEQAKAEFKRSKGQGAEYDRAVLGIRRTLDNAVYSNFSEKNILPKEITPAYFENTDTYRVIAIDPGYNHECGMLDVEIANDNSIVYPIQEKLLKTKGKTMDYVLKEYWDLVRSRKGRRLPLITLVDPSRPEYISYFKENKVPVKDVDNTHNMQKGKSKRKSIETQNKDLIGHELIRFMIDEKAIMIGRSCPKLISSLYSYKQEYNEKTARMEVVKIGDELPDCLRYIINTVIKSPRPIINGLKAREKNGENELLPIQKNVGEKKTQKEKLGQYERNIREAITKKLNSQRQQTQNNSSRIQSILYGNKNRLF